MTLLTIKYAKMVRREKLTRLLLGLLIVFNVSVLIGATLMLPSYFLLVLSRDEILRRLNSEKEVFAKKDYSSIANSIKSINALVSNYGESESRRRGFAPLLNKIVSGIPAGIKISLLILQKNGDGGFALSIQGLAQKRDDFLSYLAKLKTIPEAEEVVSPVSNLLKDRDLDFSLNFIFKKGIYGYAAK